MTKGTGTWTTKATWAANFYWQLGSYADDQGERRSLHGGFGGKHGTGDVSSDGDDDQVDGYVHDNGDVGCDR